jgi:hypothetical protein
MPPQPPKRGSLFIVPQAIRPQLVRTGIEVYFLKDFYFNKIRKIFVFLDSLLGNKKYENIYVIRC